MNSARRGFTIGSTLAAAIIFLGGLATRGADTPRKPANDPPRLSPADRLVREALAAEVSGDNTRRDELLSQALKEDPNCGPARWQSEFVSVDGKWLAPDDAARRFAGDPNLAEYRRHRDEAVNAGLFSRGPAVTDENVGTRRNETYRSEAISTGGIAAHTALARWCRTKRLADEARAHWTQVLMERPSNAEAQAHLGLHWFMGGLYTNAQIDEAKSQHAQEEKQLSDWKPAVRRWRKALDDGSALDQVEVASEMKRCSDVTVVTALEWADFTDAPKHPSDIQAATHFQRQAIALLGRLPQQRATYSLTGHAVLAPHSEARSVAADELKGRPLHDFVPILLAGLANPIEFGYAFAFDRSDGIAVYEAVASQEGPDTFRENTILASAAAASGGPRNWSEVPGALLVVRQAQLLTASFANQNARIEQMNDRINTVLERVTNQRATDNDRRSADADVIPDAAVRRRVRSRADFWWQWWARFNEAHVPERRIATWTSVRPTFQNGMMSCFAAGTPVATSIGPVAIEKLQIGDRVLAQDADSGEVAFKPVLGTTVRPPVDMVLVTTTAGELRTTRGHPFWIVGKGWRMAKELQVGDRVHSLAGGATVTALAKQPPEAAYNLIVADFGTYFVGNGRILVHDNTPRLPTPAAIPGYVADR